MNYYLCLIIILIFLKIYLLRLIYINSTAKKDLEKKLKKSILETLELSTSDQLLKELRTRNNTPYILILPVKENYYNGLTVESHCLNDISSLALLHLAKSIAVQNIKKNGGEVPKFPPLRDYFE